MSDTIAQVYIIDGRHFATKADAVAYQKRPKIVAALKASIGSGENESKIVDWLVENQEDVEVAFEIGTIKRVTKVELKRLQTQMDALVAAAAADPAFAKTYSFLVDNAAAVVASYRHPSVKRMTDEEKTAGAIAYLTEKSGNAGLAQFIVEKKDTILEGYGAAKEKKAPHANATNALAEYRAKKAAEKAAKEAAEAETTAE